MPNCSWSSFLNCNVDFTCVAKRLAGSFNIVQREMTAEGLRSRGAEGNPDRLRPPAPLLPSFSAPLPYFPALASFWRETKDPEGVQQDSPGRKPWVQGQIAESPERAAQRSSVSTPDKCSS